MNVLNVIRSFFLCTIGYGVFAALSIWLILTLFGFFGDINADGNLVKILMKLVDEGELDQLGYTFAMIADDMFYMIAWLNVWSLVATVVFALGWSLGSHFLNVDAPGKAKVYAIHWLVVSGIFIGLLLIINVWVLNSTRFPASQDITKPGTFTLTFYIMVYYTLAYYLSVLLGTARFARSSVLLANKLPALEIL